MGCCGSKESHDDDVQEPLLHNELSNTDGHMNYQTCEGIDTKMEQEFWNDIIERTTNNLIDVSNVQADPLQTQDIQERQGRYQQILDNAKSGMSDQMHPSLEYSTVNATSPADLLASIRPNDDLSSKELDWLYKAMDDVHDAIRAIEVEPVGDVVVQLTMTENNSFGNHHAIRA